ncbi:hypothetical protein R2F25_18465 [Streptomyces sp. UP1A-1]|nr:hypothetical protein [Streptomyces sp. UP1A-1]
MSERKPLTVTVPGKSRWPWCSMLLHSMASPMRRPLSSRTSVALLTKSSRIRRRNFSSPARPFAAWGG